MSKKIACITIRLTLLLLLLPFQLPAQTINGKIIHTISFQWLEGCETGKGNCNPVLITRQHVTDTVQLVFPSGGTSSSVYLYAGSAISNPLREDNKRAGQGKPCLYLTGLPDGRYHVHMLSCAVGGIFSIIIKTN